MAAVTGAVIAAGAAAYSANRQAKAAKEAGKAAGAGIAEQQAARQQMRDDLMPYMSAGSGALSQLQALNSGDYSGFQNSPDYLWAKQQTIQGADRSAAQRGGLYSGGHQADLQDRLTGLASQQLGAYRGSLMSLANMGQNSAAGVGQSSMGAANSIGNLLQQQGQARGDQAQAYAGLAGALGGLATGYANNRASTYSGTANPSYASGFGNNYANASNAGSSWGNLSGYGGMGGYNDIFGGGSYG